MSNPVYWENKKNIINLSSAELAKRVVKKEVYPNPSWKQIPTFKDLKGSLL